MPAERADATKFEGCCSKDCTFSSVSLVQAVPEHSPSTAIITWNNLLLIDSPSGIAHRFTFRNFSIRERFCMTYSSWSYISKWRAPGMTCSSFTSEAAF